MQQHERHMQAQLQRQMQPLPVSAVTAGRVRLRTDAITQGSDIMADALAEEEIAQAAQKFMAMQKQQPPPWYVHVFEHTISQMAALKQSALYSHMYTC